MSLTAIRALIEAGLDGARVVICTRCKGWGVVGLPSLAATCPNCCGAGRTITTQLEVSHDTH